MDELIKQLTGRLGLDESVAKMATAKIMAIIKENVGDELFGKIASAVPEANQMAQSDAGSPTPKQGGGGMLGSLAGMASSALGGSAGNTLEVGAALSEAGLPAGKIGEFVTMLIAFLRQHVGDDVAEQVLAKFPMLKTLLG